MLNQMIYNMDDFEKEYPEFDWKIHPHTNILGAEIVHALNTNTSENRLILQNK